MRKTFILFLTSFLLVNINSPLAITCSNGNYYNVDNYQGTTINDPLILFNKYMFTFNMIIDGVLLEPAAKTYTTIIPTTARKHVSSVFQNINTPLSTLSHALMGDFEKASQSFVRFLVNSTFGFAGMMDVAKDFGLKDNKANFTSVLEKWKIPDGPYIMLPILGPSTLGSAVVTLGEFKVYPNNTKLYKKHIAIPRAINQRSEMRAVFNTVKSSIDPYTSAKSQYIQYRCKDKQPSYE